MKKSVCCVMLMALVTMPAFGAIVDVFGTSGDMESRPDATTVRFEDYVGTYGSAPGDRGDITINASNTDDYTNPSLGAAAVGLLIGAEDWDGNPVNVNYQDASTGYFATDLMGPANTRPRPGCYGNKLIFTFVDPANPATKATVAGVSFRWGNVDGGNSFKIRFYDVDGNEIGATDNDIPVKAGTLQASTRSYVALDSLGGSEVSEIHQVKMIYEDYTNNDYWTVGTYVDNAAKVDMSFVGYVPEPASLILLGLGGVALRKRK